METQNLCSFEGFGLCNGLKAFVSEQRQATNELATCCTPCFSPPAQVSILPHQVSEEMSTLLGQTEGFIIPCVCCGQEAGTPRRREQASLASPKRSPRWPCLGGETDGAVPLKAHQHQLTTRPTPPSTPPPSTATHTLNYSCAPAKSDKGPFEVQVRRMTVAFSTEAA